MSSEMRDPCSTTSEMKKIFEMRKLVQTAENKVPSYFREGVRDLWMLARGKMPNAIHVLFSSAESKLNPRVISRCHFYGSANEKQEGVHVYRERDRETNKSTSKAPYVSRSTAKSVRIE